MSAIFGDRNTQLYMYSSVVFLTRCKVICVYYLLIPLFWPCLQLARCGRLCTISYSLLTFGCMDTAKGCWHPLAFSPGYVYVGGTGVMWRNFIWWRFEVQKILVVWLGAYFFLIHLCLGLEMLAFWVCLFVAGRGQGQVLSPWVSKDQMRRSGAAINIFHFHITLAESRTSNYFVNPTVGRKWHNQKSVLVYGIYIISRSL